MLTLWLRRRVNQLRLTHEQSFWSLVATFALLNCCLLLQSGHYKLFLKTTQISEGVDTPSNRLQPAVAKVVNASLSKLKGFELAEHVRKECLHLNTSMNLTQLLLDIYAIKSHNSIICPVEKVASTFWRRVVYLAENEAFKSKHPYQVSINSALGQKFTFLKNGNDNRLRDDFKFVFVRDPYTRVLSAYIDKVFSPNPMFWDIMGHPAIIKFRNKGGDSAKRKCFHDATFPEFIQFVLWSEKEQKMTDSHFVQASEKCRPCFVNYSYIGKMESFKDDAPYIFDRFELEGAQRSLSGNMKELADRDAIEDSVTSPFQWRRYVERCMSWHEALRRVWRKIQMRGLIDIDLPYPLDAARTNRANKNEILKLALKAWKDSDPAKLKIQKRMVVSELYGSLPTEMLEQFRQTYADDFQLFKYSDRPTVLTENYEKRNFTVL